VVYPLQAFASPAKLAEMVTRVNEALAGPLPAAVARMRLYLPNPSTHAILFKPVKSNLMEAHAQVRPRVGSKSGGAKSWAPVTACWGDEAVPTPSWKPFNLGRFTQGLLGCI
jgi:hypothetical protein